MNVKILEGGTLPERKTDGSHGYDCIIRSVQRIDVPMPDGTTEHFFKCGLGIALEMPLGYEAQIRGRSSAPAAGSLVILGTTDADYRGEVFGCCIGKEPAIGDRIFQIVFAPVFIPVFVLADTLSTTARGASGFGSTGK